MTKVSIERCNAWGIRVGEDFEIDGEIRQLGNSHYIGTSCMLSTVIGKYDDGTDMERQWTMQGAEILLLNTTIIVEGFVSLTYNPVDDNDTEFESFTFERQVWRWKP